MASAGLRAFARDARERFADHCACLFSPARSPVAVKAAVVLLHAIYIVPLLVLDNDFVWNLRRHPWVSALYALLLVACLFQYFYTSGSSPGYVLDAMRGRKETNAASVNFSRDFIQSASRTGSFRSLDTGLLERGLSHANSSSWLKIVMDLYPPGSSSRNWTCSYCNIIQPPRSRHCHDCDKCVLRFDHHCVWLGTCIGIQNHCRFWWYIFEESILGTWTIVYYFTFLRSDNDKEWWQDVIALFLLATLLLCVVFLLLLLLFHSYLALTNQTTYELVRRRRILYLRGLSPRVCPFSKGICRNLYAFCCAPKSVHALEGVPTMEELEAIARPYTCIDLLTCRCC